MVATSWAVRPLTMSMSIEVAAWLIAQPRPWNLTSAIVSPSKATAIETSSPQSGFCPSATASASSMTPCPRGFL